MLIHRASKKVSSTAGDFSNFDPHPETQGEEENKSSYLEGTLEIFCQPANELAEFLRLFLGDVRQAFDFVQSGIQK